MANKKPDARKYPTPHETEAFLKEMRAFRDKAVEYSFLWSARSGARYTADAMIRGIDELGFVLTGNDRLFSAGELQSTLRRRRGWDC